MLESLTPGAQRALARAHRQAEDRGAAFVWPSDLLAALLDDRESRAASILDALSLRGDLLEAAIHRLPLEPEPAGAGERTATREPGELAFHSPALRGLLADALERARSVDRLAEVGTEHLLAALVAGDASIRALLAEQGIVAERVLERFERTVQAETAPIPLAPEIPPLELTTPGEGVDLARILDASANRAREGLRVVEDYVRFALDDPLLTRRLKDCRHRLGRATRALESEGHLIGARDTAGDVGTHIMTPSERARENPRAVLAANFKRTGEALRSLEEYAKLLDPWLAGRFEVLRYDIYTLEKLVLTAVAARASLHDARLYLLAGGQSTLAELVWVVREALLGGVQVVQLREKGLPDREVLSRARELRLLAAEHHAHFLVNDRPDLARLSGAHGVHLGQDDVTVRDARRIVGPHGLIGVSTHDSHQLERAILDGAGYLGVGPVFPSATKSFDDLAGLAFVGAAAEATNCPWFAIGGITLENLPRVLEAGARRVAVSSAICQAVRPRDAARAMRDLLEAAEL
jgi:thiamine-phosphate pyrophosphorylase